MNDVIHNVRYCKYCDNNIEITWCPSRDYVQYPDVCPRCADKYDGEIAARKRIAESASPRPRLQSIVMR